MLNLRRTIVKQTPIFCNSRAEEMRARRNCRSWMCWVGATSCQLRHVWALAKH